MKALNGAIVHFELNAKDTARAKRFYSSLFGWKFKPSSMPGLDDYLLIDGIEPGGAINGMSPEQRGPVVYLATESIDGSIKKVRDLGGKADAKQPIPTQGWFANCVDTEGNTFSLFESDPSVTAETEQQYQQARA